MSSSLVLKNGGIKTGTHGYPSFWCLLAFWLNDVRLTLRPRSGSDARHLNANGGPIFQEEAGNRRNVPRRRLWLWHFHYVHLYPQCYQVITISAPNREKMKLGTTLLLPKSSHNQVSKELPRQKCDFFVFVQIRAFFLRTFELLPNAVHLVMAFASHSCRKVIFSVSPI